MHKSISDIVHEKFEEMVGISSRSRFESRRWRSKGIAMASTTFKPRCLIRTRCCESNLVAGNCRIVSRNLDAKRLREIAGAAARTGSNKVVDDSRGGRSPAAAHQANFGTSNFGRKRKAFSVVTSVPFCFNKWQRKICSKQNVNSGILENRLDC